MSLVPSIVAALCSAEILLWDEDKWGPMMYKILTCLERLSIRFPPLNEAVSVLIIQQPWLLSGLEGNGERGRRTVPCRLPQCRHSGYVPYGHSERRTDPMKGSLASRSSDLDKSKFKQ